MNKIFFILFMLFGVYANSQDLGHADTTILRTKIIKQNKFFINDTFNIDTNQRFVHLFDPYHKHKAPLISLGQIGTPSLPMIFIYRKENSDFLFLNPYSEYLYIPKKSEYFKTNTPFTDIKYIGVIAGKLKEEQYIKLIHTQSPDINTNFGLEYKLLTAMDIPNQPQNSTINNLNIWYYKQIKKYNIYSSIFFNQIKRVENGGMIDTASNFHPLNDNNAYYISDVKNKITYQGIYINQAFDLSKKIKIRHTLNYFTLSKTFFETTPNTSYFGPTNLTEEQSYDSTGIRTLDNSFAFILNKKMVLAATNRLQKMYYFRGFLYNLKGEFLADNFLTLGIRNVKLKNIKSDLITNYHFTSRNEGNFDISSNNYYSIDFAKKTIFSLSIDYKKYTPDYFYENYNGNYYSWENNFEKISTFSTSLDANFTSFNLTFGGDYRQLYNYTYFDTLSLPAQDTNLLTIKTLYLKKTFNFKPFVIDLNLYYQLVNNQDILHIPKYSAYASIFADFSLFKKALIINMGVDVYYYSKFNTYGYNASLGMFYLANNRISGNYPIFNLFLSGKIKSATVILRLDNAVGFLLYPYHETVEHYHISDFYIRFGVHWWFKN